MNLPSCVSHNNQNKQVKNGTEFININEFSFKMQLIIINEFTSKVQLININEVEFEN